MDEDLSVQWSLANPLTIQIDEAGNAWNAGAAREVVALDSDRILVATDTGGIWLVHFDGTSVCVADVQYPDFWCITNGQYGHPHFYAAGTKLYETDLSKTFAPQLARDSCELARLDLLFKPVTFSPQAIYRMLILREDKRIVLATRMEFYGQTFHQRLTHQTDALKPYSKHCLEHRNRHPSINGKPPSDWI